MALSDTERRASSRQCPQDRACRPPQTICHRDPRRVRRTGCPDRGASSQTTSASRIALPSILAVASNPAATKAARISASFEACLAFARRCLLRCRIAHSTHKFVSLLVLGSVVSGLRYSSLRAPSNQWSFGYVSLKNITNARWQFGICQHAFGGLRI